MAKKNSGNYKIPQIYPVPYTDSKNIHHTCAFLGMANFPNSKLHEKAEEIGAKLIQTCQDHTWINKYGLEKKDSLTLEQLEELYRNGIEFNGTRYFRLVRSAGEAKLGNCIFCDEAHVAELNKFLTLGFETKKLVELEAYKSLASSAIVDRFHVKLSEIFFVKDWDTDKMQICNVFKTDKNGIGYMETDVECKVESIAWDGMSLIDSSILPKGFACLRGPFFKTAALSCNIQQYFKDVGVQGKQLTDASGRRVRLSSVKLITSLENCKFRKLEIPWEQWFEAYHEWGDEMTVVKSTHESKWSKDIVQISYQMYSVLNTEEAKELRELNREYVRYFSNEGFLEYLQSQKNSLGYGAVFEKYWNELQSYQSAKDFRHNMIRYCPNDTSKEPHGLRTQIRKRGRLFVPGNNCTAFGSPMSMLHYVAFGELKDFMNKREYGYSVYTPSFEVGETLALMRSPFNSASNSLVGFNTSYDWLKYFNLTKYEIIVDSVETDLEARANSQDFDSDFNLTTNCKPFVTCCLRASVENRTVVNAVEKEGNKYENTPENLAKIDHDIHEGNAIVGKSADLACAHNLRGSIIEADSMAVLGQISIDSAKRKFDIKMVKTYNAFRELSDGKYHSGKTQTILYFDENNNRIPESKATKESTAITASVYHEEDDSKYFGTRLDLLNDEFKGCETERSRTKKFGDYETPDDGTIEKIDEFLKQYNYSMETHTVFTPNSKFINAWKSENLVLWLLCNEELPTKYKRNRVLLVDYIYKWYPAKVESAIDKMAK